MTDSSKYASTAINVDTDFAGGCSRNMYIQDPQAL